MMAKEFKEGGDHWVNSNRIYVLGGIMTKEDFANYKVRVDEGVLINDHFRGDLVMCGGPPPSSFAVTQLIVSVMSSKFLGKCETARFRNVPRRTQC